MKRVLLFCWISFFSLLAYTQDFVTLFMDEHENDSNLTCVTISPKMMEEILHSDVEKNEDMLEVITSLKSMRILDSKVQGEVYFTTAKEVAEKNSKKFEEYLSYNDTDEDYHILVRRKKENIIELAMLLLRNDVFVIISCTGKDIKPEFISGLANSMKHKQL